MSKRDHRDYRECDRSGFQRARPNQSHATVKSISPSAVPKPSPTRNSRPTSAELMSIPENRGRSVSHAAAVQTF
jgi:hypothetical protein